jgi:hypothetical protein
VGVGSVRGEVFVGVCAIAIPIMLQLYLVTSFVVVAIERSGRYVEAAVAADVGTLVREAGTGQTLLAAS